MRRFLVLGALMLAGCGTTTGPFAARKPQRVDDPMVSIPEQQARGRDRLALPDETNINKDNLAPRLYIDRPDPLGR